jgi:hypothetical protein
METALLAAGLLALTTVAWRSPESLALPLFGVAASLLHPEAALVYPLYWLLQWPSIRHRGPHRARVIVFLVLLGAVFVVRRVYFHQWVPNTFYSKPSDWARLFYDTCLFLLGRNTNIPFPFSGWLSLPLLALGYGKLRRHFPDLSNMLLACTGAGLFFALYSRPDWTETGRYFAPYLPCALILFWTGTLEGVVRLFGTGMSDIRRNVVIAGVGLLVLGASLSDAVVKLAQVRKYPGYVMVSEELIEPSKWIGAHVPGNSVIATRRIGALAYFSKVRVFDYTYGLPDPEVAQLVAANSAVFDDPNDPLLGPLWQERQPDYLLEDEGILQQIAGKSGGSLQHFSVHGLEYEEWKRFPVGRDNYWILARRVNPKKPL